jgi:hypothetical protein
MLNVPKFRNCLHNSPLEIRLSLFSEVLIEDDVGRIRWGLPQKRKRKVFAWLGGEISSLSPI